jgi:CubicO group peptidase (beta-lactamase class C family)
MFMGSVLVAKEGKPVFNRSYGMASLEWSVPNSPTTRFNIASMTKQFTAAAILLLEDRGKLKTDDLVKKYLPAAPASWDDITIYHLLTHTSGISDNAVKYVPGTPDKLDFNDEPLNFQTGERWAYSNLGYIVLGYLLERISGQTYEEFVEQNIFKPLGMNDSGMFSFVTVIPRRASGYWPGRNGIENADHFDARLGFSAGSIYSTTEDLLRWENGLFGGRLLSPASLRKMITPFKSDYGCGLYIKRVNGHLMIEHDGNNIGFNSDMAYYPEEGIAVIVLANLNGTVTSKIARALAAVARGETPPIPSIHLVAQVQKGPLTESEAVALAERFIAENGYTDLPPDKTKLSHETIEWESNTDKMLEQRHDTLERRAYGVRSGRKGSEPGWTVVFRYKHPGDGRSRSNGRAVTMNLDGSKPRVEHVDFILRYAKKL